MPLEDFEREPVRRVRGDAARRPIRATVRIAADAIFDEIVQNVEVADELRGEEIEGRDLYELLKHTRRKVDAGEDLTDFHVSWLRKAIERFRAKKEEMGR